MPLIIFSFGKSHRETGCWTSEMVFVWTSKPPVRSGLACMSSTQSKSFLFSQLVRSKSIPFVCVARLIYANGYKGGGPGVHYVFLKHENTMAQFCCIFKWGFNILCVRWPLIMFSLDGLLDSVNMKQMSKDSKLKLIRGQIRQTHI